MAIAEGFGGGPEKVVHPDVDYELGAAVSEELEVVLAGTTGHDMVNSGSEQGLEQEPEKEHVEAAVDDTYGCGGGVAYHDLAAGDGIYRDTAVQTFMTGGGQ